jgi:predicted nucleotidyltransferase
MDHGPYIRSLRQRDREIRAARRERAAAVEARLPAVVRRLIESFGVTQVVLFGSLLTGELHDGSDLDLAVAGLAPAEYWRAIDMAAEEAGIPVDLVRLEEARGSLTDRIRSEGRVLHG